MGKLGAAREAAQAHQQFNGRFAGVYVLNGKVSYTGDDRKLLTKPLGGAVAEFETGADAGSRTTLTRVAAGAIVAGPVGAIVGGMFKKDRNKVYVSITFPDGDVMVVDAPAKDDAKAREFARKINAAGQHYM